MDQSLATALTFIQTAAPPLREETKLGQITQLIEDLTFEKTQLLGIEHERKNMIDQQLKKLHQDQSKLSKLVNAWELGYQQWIPIQPLLWRHSQLLIPNHLPVTNRSGQTVRHISTEPIYGNMPSLGIFVLESPIALLFDLHSINPIYPQRGAPAEIYAFRSTLYQDVNETLQSIENRLSQQVSGFSLTVSAKFSGTMPQTTRQRIHSLKEANAFEYIWIIAEVENWDVEATTSDPAYNPQPSLRRDPLVVGWSSLQTDKLWYIDAFDITDLENQIPISL